MTNIEFGALKRRFESGERGMVAFEYYVESTRRSEAALNRAVMECGLAVLAGLGLFLCWWDANSRV